jgi:uncharacterized protein YecE (DUF72 family)
MGELRVGTSGYAYKEWKGNFYPEKLPADQMLDFYAQQFRTVEANNTFYRMPVESLFEKWGAAVPDGFQFALKLNQQVTHIRRLRECESTLKRFLEVAAVLQPNARLGPVLVQLPPNFKADLALLDAFLALRPSAFRFAVEVRHASWYTDDFYTLLRKHGVSLCLAETDEFTPPLIASADFVYARLRKTDYTAKEIAAWKSRTDEWLAGGADVYVYFKHEEAGKGPAFAKKLLAAKK